MVRVDIETIVMAAGPVPSLIVLRERCGKSDSTAPLRSLSIQTGSFEAAAISRGIDSGRAERPITHDLLLDTVDALGAKLERIEIVRAEPPVFYATIVVLVDGDERNIDARPSDAIALAVRSSSSCFCADRKICFAICNLHSPNSFSICNFVLSSSNRLYFFTYSFIAKSLRHLFKTSIFFCAKSSLHSRFFLYLAIVLNDMLFLLNTLFLYFL